MNKPFHYGTEKWHNIRYTYAGGHVVKTDFEMSVEDAVNTALFEKSGIDNLEKVEYAGTERVGAWQDVTGDFKRRYKKGSR